MEITKSEYIYQTVVSISKNDNDIEILDYLDSIDYDELDMSNMKILHMIYMYIGLKIIIKEYNFAGLLDKLKTFDENSNVVYNIIIKSLIGNNIHSYNYDPDESFWDQKINDEYFTHVINYMSLVKYFDLFNFKKYIYEIKLLYEKMSNSLADTDFLQITELKNIIYITNIQFFECELSQINKLNNKSSGIITMITQIEELINKRKFEDAKQEMEKFRLKYGANRLKHYLDSFILKIQFETIPSSKNALLMYNYKNEHLTTLNNIEIEEYRSFNKIRWLISSANRLRIKKLYNDYDQLSIIITSETFKISSKYQTCIKKCLEINALTIESSKTLNYTKYLDYIINLINIKYYDISFSLLGDIIKIKCKNNDNEWEYVIEFYKSHSHFINYNVKKILSDENILPVTYIIKSYYNANFINSINSFNNLLKSFGLTIDFFKSNIYHINYIEITRIHSEICNNMMSLIFNGYKIFDNNYDNSLYLLDESYDPICMLCKEIINNMITSVIQCNDCKRYIGHLQCFKKYNKFGPNKVCCGIIIF